MRNSRYDASEKEREHSELEAASLSANRSLQQAENLVSSLKSQLKAKREEVKGPRFTDGIMSVANPMVSST